MTKDIYTKHEYPMSATRQANLGPLPVRARAAGLPVTHVNGSPETDTVVVCTSRDLTPSEKLLLDRIVSDYDGRSN